MARVYAVEQLAAARGVNRLDLHQFFAHLRREGNGDPLTSRRNPSKTRQQCQTQYGTAIRLLQVTESSF